jgi:hypothetical protein
MRERELLQENVKRQGGGSTPPRIKAPIITYGAVLRDESMIELIELIAGTADENPQPASAALSTLHFDSPVPIPNELQRRIQFGGRRSNNA